MGTHLRHLIALALGAALAVSACGSGESAPTSSSTGALLTPEQAQTMLAAADVECQMPSTAPDLPVGIICRFGDGTGFAVAIAPTIEEFATLVADQCDNMSSAPTGRIAWGTNWVIAPLTQLDDPNSSEVTRAVEIMGGQSGTRDQLCATV